MVKTGNLDKIDKNFVEPGVDFWWDICCCRRLVNTAFDIISEGEGGDLGKGEIYERGLAILDSVRIRLRDMDYSYSDRVKEEPEPLKKIK